MCSSAGWLDLRIVVKSIATDFSGQVIVGCRLTSLGMALLTHLPDSSVSSLHQYQPGLYMPSLNGVPEKPAEPKANTDEKMNISKALLDVADEKTIQVADKFQPITI